jgi:Na+-driven multidrug efflux pump
MASTNGVDFTKGNLTKHVSVMSFTASIGILAIYIVDLLDLLFISMLGDKEMAAAAGMAGTLLFFVSTINIGLSIATGTLVGRALGKGDDQQAREMTGTAIMVSTAVGIVVPLLMIPNLYFLLGLIGATDELADLAYSYIIILLPATFLSGISMNLVSHLRADGAAAKAMYPSLCGALVNLIFDPILIFGLGMGLQGAARRWPWLFMPSGARYGKFCFRARGPCAGTLPRWAAMHSIQPSLRSPLRSGRR